MRKGIRTKLLMAEMGLLLASVFVFRGLWHLLDRHSFMDHPVALWASLVIGVTASIPALRYIIRHG